MARQGKRHFVCVTCGVKLVGQQIGGHRRSQPSHDIEEVLNTGERVTYQVGVLPKSTGAGIGFPSDSSLSNIPNGSQASPEIPSSSKTSQAPFGGIAQVRYDSRQGKFLVAMWLSIDALFKYHWLKDGRSGLSTYNGKLEDFVEWAISDAFLARGLQVPSAVMDPKLARKVFATTQESPEPEIEEDGNDGNHNAGPAAETVLAGENRA